MTTPTEDAPAESTDDTPIGPQYDPATMPTGPGEVTQWEDNK